MQKVKSYELSLRVAAIGYGIPKSTLSDHVKGVSSKRYGGCSTVFTRDEREIGLICQILVCGFQTLLHVRKRMRERGKEGSSRGENDKRQRSHPMVVEYG